MDSLDSSPPLIELQWTTLRELCNRIDANMVEIRCLRNELGLQPGEGVLNLNG